MLDDELYQLVTGNEGEDQPRYGEDDRLRHVPYHGEDARREVRRGHAHIAGDLPHTGVDRIENACEIAHYPADKKLFEPVRYRVKNTAQIKYLVLSSPRVSSPSSS